MTIKAKAGLWILAVLGFIGLATYILLRTNYLLPQPYFDVTYSKTLYSQNGKLLSARVAADEQWRLPLLENQAIPDKYKQALLTFEDKRFYSHLGLDPLALLRAIKQNLSAGKIVSGASTINMQVARLIRGNKPRNYTNKFIEILIALALEVRHDKAEILRLYTDNAPFGGNIVGIESASWRYLGRPLSELSWAEAALLAILPNQPGLLRVDKNRAKLRSRRDQLLDKLHQRGFLSATDLRLAKLEAIPSMKQSMPHQADHLLLSMSQESSLKANKILIDGALQARTLSITKRYGKKNESFRVHNLAVLVLRNSDQSIAAYVGNNPTGRQSSHGKAIDLVHRPRSSGSILKPILYAAMLDAGHITPLTLVSDVPTFYGGYAPENYDEQFRGVVRAEEMLTRSLNVPAVRMLKLFGTGPFYKLLDDLDFSTLNKPAAHYGLSLILGGAEVTLWDSTQAYSRFARALEFGAARPKASVLSRGSIWLMFEAMKNVIRPDDYRDWQDYQSAQNIAWKTGTSYGSKDAWAIGVNRDYTVGVWAGNASGEGRPEISGLNLAAPVLFDVFNTLPKTTWFTQPFDALKVVRVCNNDGFLANRWCESSEVWVPRNSHFSRLTPYHLLVKVDKKSGLRVHSGCELTANMVSKAYFQLNPAQQYFNQNTQIRSSTLPPWRDDCQTRSKTSDESIMQLVYPQMNSKIYIPTQLDGQRGHVIFRAAHREQSTVIHWHLDDTYLGSTDRFHEIAIQAKSGQHRLRLVDEHGRFLQQRFVVLDKNEGIESASFE